MDNLWERTIILMPIILILMGAYHCNRLRRSSYNYNLAYYSGMHPLRLR